MFNDSEKKKGQNLELKYYRLSDEQMGISSVFPFSEYR